MHIALIGSGHIGAGLMLAGAKKSHALVFNAQGAENLANPVYGGVPATHFFCGDDAEARKQMKQLVEDVGCDAVHAGPLKTARLIEPLMLLWVTASQSLGTRDIAFKLLRR